jgi:hypothetical protein
MVSRSLVAEPTRGMAAKNSATIWPRREHRFGGALQRKASAPGAKRNAARRRRRELPAGDSSSTRSAPERTPASTGLPLLRRHVRVADRHESIDPTAADALRSGSRHRSAGETAHCRVARRRALRDVRSPDGIRHRCARPMHRVRRRTASLIAMRESGRGGSLVATMS